MTKNILDRKKNKKIGNRNAAKDELNQQIQIELEYFVAEKLSLVEQSDALEDRVERKDFALQYQENIEILESGKHDSQNVLDEINAQAEEERRMLEAEYIEDLEEQERVSQEYEQEILARQEYGEQLVLEEEQENQLEDENQKRAEIEKLNQKMQKEAQREIEQNRLLINKELEKHKRAKEIENNAGKKAGYKQHNLFGQPVKLEKKEREVSAVNTRRFI